MSIDLKAHRRIATEEAFSIPEVAAGLRGVAWAPGNSLDLILVKRIYDAPPNDAPQMAALLPRLLDLEDERLRDMDENGVAVHLLSLTAPGVQMFDADTATDLAALANDRLAEVIKRHPTRFAGLATFAPQSPKRAAKEMERAIKTLKLNGFIVNSHTTANTSTIPSSGPPSKPRRRSTLAFTSTRERPRTGWPRPSGTMASTARSGVTASKHRRKRCA